MTLNKDSGDYLELGGLGKFVVQQSAIQSYLYSAQLNLEIYHSILLGVDKVLGERQALWKLH